MRRLINKNNGIKLILVFCITNIAYSATMSPIIIEDILTESYNNKYKGGVIDRHYEVNGLKDKKFIILHYTVSDTYNNTKLAYDRHGTSAHFTVENNGVIYKNVRTEDKAFHAGVSAFGDFTDLNQYSLGIENINFGFIETEKFVQKSKQLFEFSSYPGKWWFEFSEEQFVATSTLVKYLQEKFDIPPYNVLTHTDIAIGRKFDIGPMWDYKKAYKEFNAGYFYEVKNISLESFCCLKNKHYLELIRKFGYRFKEEQTTEVVRAFQMHYGYYKTNVREKDISGRLTNITKFSIINYAIGIAEYFTEKREDISSYLKNEDIYEPFREFFEY